jgi:hypothetical protein
LVLVNQSQVCVDPRMRTMCTGSRHIYSWTALAWRQACERWSSREETGCEKMEMDEEGGWEIFAVAKANMTHKRKVVHHISRKGKPRAATTHQPLPTPLVLEGSRTSQNIERLGIIPHPSARRHCPGFLFPVRSHTPQTQGETPRLPCAARNRHLTQFSRRHPAPFAPKDDCGGRSFHRVQVESMTKYPHFTSCAVRLS